MGWTYTYVGRNKKRKDIILDEIINWNNYDIVRAEVDGRERDILLMWIVLVSNIDIRMNNRLYKN